MDAEYKLSDIAVRHKRTIIAISALTLALTFFDLKIISVGTGGMSIDGLEHNTIITLLLVTNCYQAVAYTLHAYEDISRIIRESAAQAKRYAQSIATLQERMSQTNVTGPAKSKIREVRRLLRMMRIVQLRVWAIDFLLPTTMLAISLVVGLAQIMPYGDEQKPKDTWQSHHVVTPSLQKTEGATNRIADNPDLMLPGGTIRN